MRNFDDVIVSFATPPIRSALLITRVAGPKAFFYTNCLFSKKIDGICKRTSYVGTISQKDKTPIDQVVLLAYPKDNSPLGEDVVEIIAHGSPIIGKEIIEAYISLGARQAERGEFSLRAYINGKIDLVEAEAINDMINAKTKESQQKAFLSLKGETSKLINPILEEISSLVAECEVNIDFPEYEEEEKDFSNKEEKIQSLLHRINDLLEGGKKGKLYQEGVTVALIGKPNVGKSSLLNAILGEEKAIVTDIPGTTRDVIEGQFSYKGVPFRFLDTAGIRKSNDKIEEIGVSLSLKALEKADIVVEVVDASNPSSLPSTISSTKPLITVYNKEDLVTTKKNNELYISAKNGKINELLEEIYQKLGFSDADCLSPSFSSERQLSLLYQVKEALKEAENCLQNNLPLSLFSSALLQAYNLCKEILGKEATRDIEDEVFSRFCVGK